MFSKGRVGAVLLLLASLVVFFTPHIVLADPLQDQLVPRCNQTDVYTGGFSGACQLCDLITLAQNIINFAVAFSVVAATLMFAYAGVLYFTAATKPDNIKKAHGIFIKVFVGLVIILAAWLLIDIVMKTLTNQSGNLGPWNRVECANYFQGAELQRSDLLQAGGGGGGGGGGGVQYDPTKESQARAEIATIPHVSISHSQEANGGVCVTAQTSGCTNVGGLTEKAITGIRNLQQGCNCSIVITGGTEQGPHVGHTGNQVDVGFTQQIGDYLSNQQNIQNLHISQICTDPAHSQYRYHCNTNEAQPHLHIDFGP